MEPTCDVSVVIPNYNRAHHIGAAIRSALQQEGVSLEVLVCDDGSTDESCAVVESLGDPRVTWLPGPRSGGPAAPRNRGVAAASGRWVAFLDSDDTWLPGKLRAQIAVLDRTGALACATNAFRLLPGVSDEPALLHRDLPSRVTLSQLLRGNSLVTSSMVVSTQELRRLGGFPEATPRGIFEDYALWLRLAQHAPIAALNEPYVNYRDDQASSLRGAMGLELRCTASALRDFTAWRRKQRPRLTTSWEERLAMARRLGRLVSVRATLTWAARPARATRMRASREERV